MQTLSIPGRTYQGIFCLIFVDLFAGGGGSTAAAVTLDTVADEGRKKMADVVTWSPSRLCSRDGKICGYGDALSTSFLLLCLASCFSFTFHSFLILSCIPVRLYSRCSSVCGAAICYSQHVRILYPCSICLCHLCPTSSRNYFVFYSFSFFS